LEGDRRILGERGKYMSARDRRGNSVECVDAGVYMSEDKET
jgi:hypothetical protein